MKKSIIFILLALGTTVTGCNNTKEEPKDPTKIVKLEIMGTMEKNYAYIDEWDISGLYVEAIQANDERVKLNSSQYTLKLSAEAPKNMAASLSITAKYNPNKAISTTRIFNDIFVADEIYDEAQEINDYYADCDLEYTDTKLFEELQRHSFAKHSRYVKYSETGNFIKKTYDYDSTDLIPGKHKTEFFYTGKEVNYDVGTREHVWPCVDSSGLWPHSSSGVDNPNYIGGGSDMYHIRPSSNEVNTARGDAAYVDFGDSEHKSKKPTPAVTDEGGKYSLLVYGAKRHGNKYEFAKFVEPADEFKGDIARIIAYLYMHYTTTGVTPSAYRSMTGSLNLMNVLGYGSTERCIEILKKWNSLDKPNAVEKHRNHVVQQIQGNRNPFVDYPNLIDEMF